VRPTLGPVGALAREGPTLSAGVVHVDAHSFQESLAASGQAEISAHWPQELPPQHHVGEPDAEDARQMVVARPGHSERRGVARKVLAGRFRSAGQRQQGLDGPADLGPGQPVMPEAAPGLHGE
jgi:hypothetical protein